MLLDLNVFECVKIYWIDQNTQKEENQNANLKTKQNQRHIKTLSPLETAIVSSPYPNESKHGEHFSSVFIRILFFRINKEAQKRKQLTQEGIINDLQ